MDRVLASGWLIDIVLGLVVIEAFVLLMLSRSRRSAPSPAALMSNLAAGGALILALRTALHGAHWTIVSSCLLAALIAHLVDLRLRFRSV